MILLCHELLQNIKSHKPLFHCFDHSCNNTEFNVDVIITGLWSRFSEHDPQSWKMRPHVVYMRCLVN